MATTLIPFSFNTTYESWVTETIGDDTGYYFGGLPPGWTYEGILYVVFLLRMRLGLCYVGIFCNLVVLLLQLKIKSYRKTQFMFGMVLTVSDFTYTVAVLIETHLYYRNQQPIPPVYGALVLASNLLAFFAIIGVGIDRYLALCGIPLKYKFVVTTRKYGLVIAAMIIFCSIYSFIFTRWFTVNSAVVPIRIFLVLAICISASSLTYIVIGTSLLRSFNKTTLGESVKKARIQQTKRLMFAFSLILVTNGICYFPHSLFGLWLTFQPLDRRYGLLQNIIIGNWLYNIRAFNSTFNPVIYWTQVVMREISWPCARKKSNDRGTSSSTISGSTSTTSVSGDPRKNFRDSTVRNV